MSWLVNTIMSIPCVRNEARRGEDGGLVDTAANKGWYQG